MTERDATTPRESMFHQQHEHTHHPTLRDLKHWLLKSGLAVDEAETSIDHIEAFYTSHLLPAFRSPVTMAITCNEGEGGTADVQLHLLWPPGFLTEPTLRKMYKHDLTKEIESYAAPLPYSRVSIALRFEDEVSAEDPPEKIASKISRPLGAQYIGLLDVTAVLTAARRLQDLARELTPAFAAAHKAPEITQSVHELVHGLAREPVEKQHKLVKQVHALTSSSSP